MKFTPDEEYSAYEQAVRAREIVSEMHPHAKMGSIEERMGQWRFSVDFSVESPSDRLVSRIKPSYLIKEQVFDSNRTIFWVMTQKRRIYDFKRECTFLFYLAVVLVAAGVATMKRPF